MFFKAVEPKENIVINHTRASETKIPGKLIDKDGVAIWDCPGFMDTRSTAQEIANAFYIQKLFTTSKQLKFVLAITEADLKNKTNILPIVKQFTEIFTDIEFLENSVSLVITKVSNKKNLDNIKKDFDNVITQNNDNIPIKTKKMLEFLKKSIHIFHEPDEEIFVQNTEILDTINSSTEYVDLSIKPNTANIAISKEAGECAKELFEITYSNINKLIDIFTGAIIDPNKCMTSTDDNIFIKSSNVIESLPKSSLPVKYASFNRLPIHNDSLDPFLKLDQIKSLQEALFKNSSNNNSNLAEDNFLKVLEIFEEFVINNEQLKQTMQNYAYAFKQQIDINKCFSQVCGNKFVDYSHMKQALQKCKENINLVLEKEVKCLKIEDGRTRAEDGKHDIDYYKKAIKYLDLYKDDQNCIKQKANAYKNLGHIYNNQNNYKDAVLNYVKIQGLSRTKPINFLPKFHWGFYNQKSGSVQISV